jgi:hypothetical protein
MNHLLEHVMKVSPWIVVDDYCAARIIEGGHIDKVEDRVAFIEKTPRVRVRDNEYGSDYPDFLNWAERPFKGNYGGDPESRKWCDQMLVLLGYELPERESVSQ